MATNTDNRVLGIIQAYVTFKHIILFVFIIIFFIVRVLSRRIRLAAGGCHHVLSGLKKQASSIIEQFDMSHLGALTRIHTIHTIDYDN